MRVRLAAQADIERLVDLNLEVHDLHVAHLAGFFKPARREDLAEYFEAMLEREDARVLVACEDAEVVGYVLLVLRERPENAVMLEQRWLYIEQIGVAAAYRRRGHAAALVEAARKVAKEHGLGRVELETWAFNREARAFFRSQGFDARILKMAMPV